MDDLEHMRQMLAFWERYAGGPSRPTPRLPPQNPPGSSTPDRREARRKAQAARRRKKTTRKNGRR